MTDLNSISVLHYPGRFIELYESREVAEQVKSKKVEEFPVLDWRVSSVKEAIELAYQAGYQDAMDE